LQKQCRPKWYLKTTARLVLTAETKVQLYRYTLILDEIQCYRNEHCGFEQFNVVPDIIAGKAIGGGMPLPEHLLLIKNPHGFFHPQSQLGHINTLAATL
jgi:acetylornithine/succinyldiaminopimelate/putrescine aminotransferase